MAYEELYTQLAQYLNVSEPVLIALLAVITVWELVWTGLGLWKAARKNHIIWFVVMLIFNVVGIIEILYIFVFSEMKFNTKKQNLPEQKKHSTKKKAAKKKK